MTVGDVLEWVAIAALIACGYLLAGVVLALFVTAGTLFYLAQCHSSHPFPRWHRSEKAPE